MLFPLFRSKSGRRVPRTDDPSSSVNTLSQTMSLHKAALKSKNSVLDRPSTPPSSSSSEVSTPAGSPAPDPDGFLPFLPLDLPQFPSLEEALPDSWKSVKIEQEGLSTDNCGLLVSDRRDDLIGELLDQINLLRQKVRSLGDDNSRLRRELTRKRSQELMIYESKPPSTIQIQPGASFSDLRLPTPLLKEFTPPEGVKVDSPKESNASEYSYYHNLEYFPVPPSNLPVRRRQRADSLRLGGAVSPWGNLKRQRCHSLPTSKQLLQYSESRPTDGGKLELSPHLIGLLQRCSPLEPEPVVQPTPESEDIVLPFWEHPVSSTPMPELIMPKPIKPPTPPTSRRLVRRPQSRIKLTVLDPIFRCFVCSQRSGHCQYTDAVWLGERYAFFGYFDLMYYHPDYDYWGPETGVHSHNHATEDVNERLNEIQVEEEIRHYVGNVLDDEVELPSIDDEAPSDPIPHLLDVVNLRDLETYLYSAGGSANDAQLRRERHIALLDSIMEEEEQEEAPLSEPSLPSPPMTRRSSWSSGRPMFASRLTQSTLASIPELEDSSDSTSLSCPPLTEDSGSSSLESQSRKSTVTFDDFEDLNFEAVLPPAGSGGRTRTSSWPPSEVNTVPFPGEKPPTERTIT